MLFTAHLSNIFPPNPSPYLQAQSATEFQQIFQTPCLENGKVIKILKPDKPTEFTLDKVFQKLHE